jgi:CubicO group peptidase (beta-lactamase class C family)
MKALRFILIFLISITSAVAQDAIIPEAIKNYANARVDEGFNPAISIAYMEGNEVTHYHYGQTQLEGGKAVDENTVYEIGSISKVFTTILLADEVLKGRMNLDDPIAKYLPKTLTVPNRDGKEITLKDLATHTSGLPRMPGNISPADMKNPFADYTVELLYAFLSDYTLPRDIGSKYEYSNLGMGLLGHILELHTNTTYEALVIERIATPLGMEHTRVLLTDDMKANLALGYDEQMEITSNWDIPTLAGAGALRSTTSDMLIFLKANTANDDSDLNKAMKLSHALAFTSDDQTFNIGLGWHYAHNDSIVWHNGGTGGYRTFIGFLKDSDEAVVVLTNSTFSTDGIGLKLLGQPIDLEMPEKKVFPDEVKLEPEVLVTYTGKYELAPTFHITITQKDNRLFLQATAQPQFEIFASAENEFFLKVVEAKITFNKDENNKVISLTLNQNGQSLPGLKLDE